VEPGETFLPAEFEATSRLVAPLHLSEACRAVWLMTVNAQPADSFSPVHLPLLEAYCGHVTQMRLLTEEVQNFERAWLSDKDGLRRYDRLLGMLQRETRAASALATRLRITRQSADESRTVGAKNARQRVASTQVKPWER
jgi:hypothetical protein